MLSTEIAVYALGFKAEDDEEAQLFGEILADWANQVMQLERQVSQRDRCAIEPAIEPDMMPAVDAGLVEGESIVFDLSVFRRRPGVRVAVTSDGGDAA